MYLLLKALREYRERNNDNIFSPLPKPPAPNPDLLKEAIADAKAVRATALANARRQMMKEEYGKED